MVLSLIKKNTDKLFLAFIILSTLTPRFEAIDNNAIRWLSLSLICCIYLFVDGSFFWFYFIVDGSFCSISYSVDGSFCRISYRLE